MNSRDTTEAGSADIKGGEKGRKGPLRWDPELPRPVAEVAGEGGDTEERGMESSSKNSSRQELWKPKMAKVTSNYQNRGR